jgi:hypothetical protein
MLNRLEVVFAVAWLFVALSLGAVPTKWRGVRRAFRRLALRKNLAAVSVGLLAAGLAALVGFIVAPEPRLHDEFSYLLGADTFARGRLTNPPHPMWVFLETFHVNQLPTYSSMYPPGQALALALGQVLTGRPIVGVWLSFGVACALVCWMLQAWLPPRWALAGGLLAAARVGFLGAWGEVPGYWSQSYWGGAVAMAGGALLLGGFRRLVSRPRAWDAVAMALGLTVLANSRPFEGLLISLPVGLVLIIWLLGAHGPGRRAALTSVVLPMGAVLVLTAGAILYYNSRLTGDPFLLPYQHNGATYAMTPLFLWQQLQPEPPYRHAAIRDYHIEWALPAYLRLRTVDGYIREAWARVRTFLTFFLGPLLLIPLAALPWVSRDHWSRLALVTCAVVLGGLLLTTWFQPHYAAPLTCLVVFLAVQAIRQLRLWHWRGRPSGRMLSASLPACYIMLLATSVWLQASAHPAGWQRHRAHIAADLRQQGGAHLVIVRYGPGHSPHQEWVFNNADIDGSPVVWARDMGSGENRHLLCYFATRTAWLLDADADPPMLAPFPKPADSAPPTPASVARAIGLH